MRETLKAATTSYDNARNVASLWMLSLVLPAFIVMGTALGEPLLGGVALVVAALLAFFLLRHARLRRREGAWARSDTIIYLVVPCAIALAVGTFLLVVLVQQGGPSPRAAAPPASVEPASGLPPIPLASGQYEFRHRYAEHPDMPSMALTARIDGRHIVLVNDGPADVFPHGVIAEGTLMWHAASRQWILGDTDADRTAADVGGCSGGPDVVDLRSRTYWTC